MKHRSASVQVATVLLLALFWAINWPTMKIGLSVVEPWTFRALTVLTGGIGCLLVARAFGESIRVPRQNWKGLLWLSLFQGVLWNAFSGFGIAYADAGRAAVLAFTMPVWATLFAIVFLRERVTPRRLLGLALGMLAMGLLLIPAFEAMGQRLIGAGLMIGGAIVWGAATIVIKANDWKVGVLTIAGWQFILGGLPLVAAAIWLGRPSSLLDLDATTALAVAYSALIPMIFCQAVWFTMVRRLPAALASMGTLLVPPLGVISAGIMLGERVGPYETASVIIVVCAMLLILPGFNWRASLRPPAASPPG